MRVYMTIYIVKQDDTINSIAERFGISNERLILDNGLEDLENLVVGQALVIVYPEQTYVVRQGDTLAGIADSNGITIIQLLRNNPYLSDREYIFPGETLIINYGNKIRNIVINGYAYPFIDIRILRKTLPFLTYLTIFNYRITEEGDLVNIEDEEIIQLAKDYGVAPVMVISTINYQGIDSEDITYNIINNPAVQDKIINNILNVLRMKGYYAANIYIQYVSTENKNLVENYIRNVTNRLNSEGYPVIVTLTPTTFTGDILSIDYSMIGQIANQILLLSYEWGFSYGPPALVTSMDTVRRLMDFAVTQVPREKIVFGIPVIGYDWQLPYIKGETRANSLSTNSAIQLASEVGATIHYDETIQAPFYYYATGDANAPVLHVVWFKDARRIKVLLDLVPEYGVQGVAIWNIMQYFSQLWLLVNSQFEIETVLKDLLRT
jgi:spore germination protein